MAWLPAPISFYYTFLFLHDPCKLEQRFVSLKNQCLHWELIWLNLIFVVDWFIRSFIQLQSPNGKISFLGKVFWILMKCIPPLFKIEIYQANGLSQFWGFVVVVVVFVPRIFSIENIRLALCAPTSGSAGDNNLNPRFSRHGEAWRTVFSFLSRFIFFDAIDFLSLGLAQGDFLWFQSIRIVFGFPASIRAAWRACWNIWNLNLPDDLLNMWKNNSLKKALLYTRRLLTLLFSPNASLPQVRLPISELLTGLTL